MDIRNRVSTWETVVAGAAAWLALNVFSYAAAPLFGISFGLVARFFGSLLFPGAGTMVHLWVGRVMFLGAALGWSLVYRWAAAYLPGPGWFRGLLFGTGIWLVSALVLPLIGTVHPISGGVVFTPGLASAPYPGFLGLGFDGSYGVTLSVLAHQAYGLTLGTVTGIQELRS